MLTNLAKPYNEAMQDLADQFLEESGKVDATTTEFALWAIRTGKWEPPPDLIVKKCKEDFAKALREQYFKEMGGKSIRAKHAARRRVGDKQLYFWADIRNPEVKRSHMVNAFSLRRDQIVGDCRQLDRDQEYWNSHRPEDEPIQLKFDFTEDVEEGKFSGEYPPKQPR